MIRTGLDIFLEKAGDFRNRRIGLIANQSSVTRELKYSWDQMIKHGFPLKKIFAPEHGIFSTEQDQVPVSNSILKNLPVKSLYRDNQSSLFLDQNDLKGIDTIVFDVQDIGCRYYTYATTLAYAMKAIHGQDIELIVLDRPNPLNGITVEGPILQKRYRSFVGEMEVPVRHGLTIGELANFYRSREKWDINLEVIQMQGWLRGMYFGDTGLYWVPPSPNMPSWETAMIYPGTCLIEGTNLSEGRGTTLPFQYMGAPFIDAYELASTLNELDLPGIGFRPILFKPTFHKFKEQTIEGVFIHIKDPQKISSFFSGISIIKTIYDMYSSEFEFLKGGYEFNNEFPAFDILSGNSSIREDIISGINLHKIQKSWSDDEKYFIKEKEGFHLYGN